MKQLLFALAIAVLMGSSASAVEYRLPFNGQWFVMAGGDTVNVNHHMQERSQWFGVDFMKTGGFTNRELTKGSGKLVTDFFAWNQPVLAPADGIVRKVHDGDIDQPLGGSDRKNAFGNYVVIETSPREFVYLAHFKKGSITVKENQKVKAGDPLGKCGNSGNTSGPHIHMHVQNQLAPYTGNGQNIEFQGITVQLSGKQFEDVTWPLIQGLFVRPGR